VQLMPLSLSAISCLCLLFPIAFFSWVITVSGVMEGCFRQHHVQFGPNMAPRSDHTCWVYLIRRIKRDDSSSGRHQAPNRGCITQKTSPMVLTTC
jgi:hypothetical protein